MCLPLVAAHPPSFSPRAIVSLGRDDGRPRSSQHASLALDAALSFAESGHRQAASESRDPLTGAIDARARSSKRSVG